MSYDWRYLLRISLAILLLANPFYLFPHAGDAAYRYEAEKIDYSRTYIRAHSQFAQVNCYNGHEPGCLLAVKIAQHGPVTINTSGFRRYQTGAEYVALNDANDGPAPFYRRVVNRSDEQVTVRLEKIPPNTLLSQIALNESELSKPARKAMQGERVTVHGAPLPEADEVVRKDGDFYVVNRVGYTPPETNRTGETIVSGAAFLTGLALILPGSRWRVA
ncbi:hypothetical protein [Haladaptatus sp. NG-SE-30]